MNFHLKLAFAAVLALSLSSLLTSCEKTPARKVADQIDKAVDNTRDAMKDAKKDLEKKQ